VQDVGGAVLNCISPGPGELASWILQRAQTAGREIAGDAAKDIAERLGAEVREPDLDRSGMRMTAAIELEKLMLAMPTGTIPLKAVQLLVADRGLGSLFAFADAIVARSGPLAARHLGRAISEPGPMVVATLHRKMRDLAQIHGAVIEEGKSVGQVARELHMHEFPAGKLADAARRWSAREISDAITGLVELDAVSKGDGERAWGPALTRWSAARIG
jgi:DNA polymerase III delta subunit